MLIKERGASKNWLKFVVNNRMKINYIHKHDIIKGSVAMIGYMHV